LGSGENGIGRGIRVEATGRAFDLAHAQEIVKSALDLEGRRMWTLSIEIGDGNRLSSADDDREKMLKKQAAMQDIGPVLNEVASGQLVGTRDMDVRKDGIEGAGLYLEDESVREG